MWPSCPRNLSAVRSSDGATSSPLSNRRSALPASVRRWPLSRRTSRGRKATAANRANASRAWWIAPTCPDAASRPASGKDAGSVGSYDFACLTRYQEVRPPVTVLPQSGCGHRRVWLWKNVKLLHKPTELPRYLPAYSAEENVAREQLEQIARKYLRGVEYELVTDLGSPATAILKVATTLSADVIVMTTHGRTGFSRAYFGSVAEDVLREAPCPVLTLHHRDTPNLDGHS